MTVALKYVTLVSYGIDWRKEYTSSVYALCCIIIFYFRVIKCARAFDAWFNCIVT